MLLRSAAREFSHAEFSDVSLGAIATKVGLTPAAIYNHFASKDDLFFATTVYMMRVNLIAIETALAEAVGWKAQLQSVLDLIRRDATGWFRFPLLISAVQLKILRKPNEFTEILKLRRAYVSQFVTIIDGAVEGRCLPSTLARKPAAELLMAFVFNALGTAMSHKQSAEENEDLFESFMALIGPADQADRPKADN